MNEEVLLSWNVVEAPPVKKSVDWFWAVGIIIISLAVISMVFGNPLFGVFLIVVLFTLIVISHKRPQTVHYVFTKDGLFEGDRFFPYTNIKSFYVDETHYMMPTLLIEIKRWFLPIVSISIPESIQPSSVRMHMRTYVMERELKEPVFHHLFEIFGL